MLTPIWTTPAAIAMYRRAVEWCREHGAMTEEEYRVAAGNLAEAEAKLRLAAERN